MPGRLSRRSLAVVALVAASCTGGSKSPRPPTTTAPTFTVLPSADRIRLGQPRLGGPAACVDDEYCAAGLGRVYGIDLGSRVVSLADPHATITALSAGAIDIGVLPSFAPEVSDPGVARLVDDRQLRPADNVVPIVDRATALRAGAVLGEALSGISAAFDQPALATLERSLASGTTPSVAAQTWLDAHPSVPIPGPGPGTTVALTIGARADSESAALTDVYAGALLRVGWSVAVVPLDGGRADELDAFSGGRINVAIENLAAIVEQLTGFVGAASADAGHTLAILQGRLGDIGLEAEPPAPAAPGVAFVVSRPVQAALGLASLSDVARAGGLRPPGPVTSVPAPASVPPVDLGVGSTGPTVVEVQSRLAALGYPAATLGTFDERTRRAVAGFQIDHGLIADGAVDGPTLAALVAATPVAHPSAPPAPGDPGSIRPSAKQATTGPPPTPGADGTPGTPGAAGTVYLAFAGGPSAVTPDILGLLRARSATASFFADDGAAGRHPDLLKAATDAGDTIGVSMDPHDTSSPVATDVLLRTASRTQEDVATFAGRTPSCLLMPYGGTNPDVRAGATARGWRVVLWDVDPQDWRRPSAASIVADVVPAVHAGSVVLLHDGGGDRSQTSAALGSLIDGLAHRGFSVSAIPDCAA